MRIDPSQVRELADLLSENNLTEIEVTDGELIEGNLPQIEGMKVGDTKAIDYKFPDSYRVEEVKRTLAGSAAGSGTG